FCSFAWLPLPGARPVPCAFSGCFRTPALPGLCFEFTHLFACPKRSLWWVPYRNTGAPDVAGAEIAHASAEPSEPVWLAPAKEVGGALHERAKRRYLRVRNSPEAPLRTPAGQRSRGTPDRDRPGRFPHRPQRAG